jgi:hypothetical protein
VKASMFWNSDMLQSSEPLETRRSAVYGLGTTSLNNVLYFLFFSQVFFLFCFASLYSLCKKVRWQLVERHRGFMKPNCIITCTKAFDWILFWATLIYRHNKFKPSWRVTFGQSRSVNSRRNSACYVTDWVLRPCAARFVLFQSLERAYCLHLQWVMWPRSSESRGLTRTFFSDLLTLECETTKILRPLWRTQKASGP